MTKSAALFDYLFCKIKGTVGLFISLFLLIYIASFDTMLFWIMQLWWKNIDEGNSWKNDAW
jgi:hypothetical protein